MIVTLTPTERALFKKQFDTKQVYKSKPICDFNLDDYKDIFNALKQYTKRIPPEFSITHELNTLYYATSENVDTLEYFKNHSFNYPRIAIIAKVFMSILNFAKSL